MPTGSSGIIPQPPQLPLQSSLINQLYPALNNQMAALLAAQTQHQSTSAFVTPQVFPVTLYDLVSNDSEPSVAWALDGQGFVINDPAAFVNQVVPSYFNSKSPFFKML